MTAAVADPSARWLYTAGKEGSIVKWDLHIGRQTHTFHKVRLDKGKGKSRDVGGGETQGHTDEVWALALSPDGKYLASGGKDRRVGVWDVEKDEWVKGFGGHRDCISVRIPRLSPHRGPRANEAYPRLHRHSRSAGHPQVCKRRRSSTQDHTTAR